MAAADDSSLRFLDEARDVVLFCRDAPGRPIGYPMRTVACGPDALVFTTYRKSAKVRHIERDPRVCVLAARSDDAGTRWVTVEGRAAVVTPSDEEIDRTFGLSPGERPHGEPRVPAGMVDLVRQRLREGKRVLLRVEQLRIAAPDASRWRPAMGLQ